MELKNYTEILVGQIDMDQNNQIFLINNNQDFIAQLNYNVISIQPLFDINLINIHAHNLHKIHIYIPFVAD